ncbi:MAG: leucine-rich repeat protein [Bacteroidales bacterium]|jgi:hypothetical protein|nr:leucine-rich repeat protein [Bacteroidales bacterium]
MKRTRLFLLAAMAVFVFEIGFSNNANGQSVGNTFVVSGVTYKLTSLSPNEVQLGTGYPNAFATNPTGSYTILDSVTGGTNNLTYSVTSIGNYAFYYCSGLTSVTIPNSVKYIGDYAFEACSGLTSVTIPNSVTSIGSDAFNGCSGLNSITIPNSVTSIGSHAFSGCSGLTSVTWNAVNCTLPTNYSHGPFYNKTSITNVTIGDSVQVIPNYLFYGCSGITETLNIPNSVTSIGYQAFYNCSGLISLTIGNSVMSIAYYAFSSCSGLTSVTWNAVNCTLPTHASYSPFFNNTSITNVTIGDSVQVIPNYLFYGCSNLTSITFPNSVTSIGQFAFYNCSGLTSVTIGNSVTSIGNYAFFDCSGFTEITSLAVTPPTIGEDCFGNVPTTIPVHVPCECEAAYQSASGWSDFTNYTDCIGNGLNDIGTTDFAIYPNPAKDVITIEGERIIGVEVVDLFGKVVYQGKETAIDVSTFAKGNYFVRVQTDKGTITKKVIVE